MQTPIDILGSLADVCDFYPADPTQVRIFVVDLRGLNLKFS